MKSYWVFELTRCPIGQDSEYMDRDVYLIVKDGVDEPDLGFIYDHFIPKTEGGEFELSGFRHCDGPGYVRHGDQKPTIRGDSAEVFFLETRKPDRAVPEPKLHDPEFRVEGDAS